ncbi:rapid alkalinization factor-like [Musa acuminata AAA Group]|uniref:rapid alkalinization factor-like n=1 Tax=Musa acuminata AAA Group TaxID=214697 RepID=UPI0031E37908
MATVLGRVHCLCVAVLLLLVSAAAGGRDVEEAHLRQLNGTIGQMHEAEEWSLGSETGRRILQSTQTSISYGALQKDRVPLQAPQPGNAYTRGCQAQYYCKS